MNDIPLCTTYFDTVKKSIALRILKHLNLSIKSVNNSNSYEEKHIVCMESLLFSDNSNVGGVLSGYFKQLCVTSARKFDIDVDDLSIVLNPWALLQNAMNFELHSLPKESVLLQNQLRWIESIVIEGREYGTQQQLSSVVDVLMHLKMDILKTLSIRSCSAHNTVSSWQALKWAYMCSTLQKFTYHGSVLENLIPLWKKAGETLTEINIKAFDNSGWALTLENLKFYCRKLTRIELIDPVRDVEIESKHFSDFLTSYGPRLIYAELPRLSAEECTNIIRKCPYASVSFTTDTKNVTAISSLANSLAKLKIRLRHGSDWSAVSSALSHCSDVHSLFISGYVDRANKLSVFKSIFRLRWLALKKLSLIICAEQAEGSLQQVANNTGSLEVIDIEIDTIRDGSVFKSLAKSNKYLKTVTICEDRSCLDRITYFDVIDVTQDSLMSFKPCEFLEYIHIKIRSKRPPEYNLDTITVPFRNRCNKVILEFNR